MKTFTYQGQPVTFLETEDREEDNIKLWHELICEKTGKSLHSIDWNPYRHMNEDDVELYLKLGCPTRTDVPSIGPLDRADLQKILAARAPKKMQIAYVRACMNGNTYNLPDGKGYFAIPTPEYRCEDINWDNPSRPTPIPGDRFPLPWNPGIQALCVTWI